VPADSIRPSEVKSWTAALHAEGLADSYIYAIHARLAQVLSDAVHDGVLTRSPVSRRTSPKAGSSVRTWPAPSTSGCCTTRWESATAPACCWRRSRA
jgi:hypothetical protein